MKKDKKTKSKKTENLTTNNRIEGEQSEFAEPRKQSKRGPGKFKLLGQGDDATLDLSLENVDRNEIVKSFGTADPEVQTHLLCQAVRSFDDVMSSKGLKKSRAVEACNITLSMLNGIQPRDEIELMLSMQIISVHNVVMQSLGGCIMKNQSIDSRERLVNQATKMLRTFTSQMQALKRYRTGGQQKVTVEHVNVNEGGQAIVGNVSQGGGGSREEKQE